MRRFVDLSEWASPETTPSISAIGTWRSLVARSVRDAEVVGSNPAVPTTKVLVRGSQLSLGQHLGRFIEHSSNIQNLGDSSLGRCRSREYALRRRVARGILARATRHGGRATTLGGLQMCPGLPAVSMNRRITSSARVDGSFVEEVVVARFSEAEKTLIWDW